MSPGVEQKASEERLAEGQEHGGAPAPDIFKPEDTRDMRDPEELGKALLGARKSRTRGSLSKLHDALKPEVLDVPDYDPSPVDHAKERERELRERAAQGDRFAEAMLRGETLAEDPVD